MESDEESMDESQLEAELERQLAEMSDVELDDEDSDGDSDDAAGSLHGASGNGSTNVSTAAWSTPDMSTASIPEEIRAIASKYDNSSQRPADVVEDSNEKRRKQLWYDLEMCRTEQETILAGFRGDLAEAKSLVVDKKSESKPSTEGTGAPHKHEGTDATLKHAPLAKATPLNDGGSFFGEAQDPNDGTDKPTGTMSNAPSTIQFTTLDPDEIGELAESARQGLSGIGAELLREQDRILAEERAQSKREQLALQALVEENQERQLASQKAEAENATRIAKEAENAKRKIEEEFRQEELRRQRAAALEQRRKQRYEEEVRRMREVSLRARQRREEAAKNAAEKEAARQKSLVELKVTMMRQARAARLVRKMWTAFVRKKKVANFLQGCYRIQRAREKADGLRRTRDAAVKIQGLYRRARARALRHDLAARRRLKVRLEREERKRKEIAEKRRREKERRHKLKLLEQADARNALREAIAIAAQKRNPNILDAAMEKYTKIVLPGRARGLRTMDRHRDTASSDEGTGDEQLFHKATAVIDSLKEEQRAAHKLEQACASAQDLLEKFDGLEELDNDHIEDHNDTMHSVRVAFKGLENAISASIASYQEVSQLLASHGASTEQPHQDSTTVLKEFYGGIAERTTSVLTTMQHQQQAIAAIMRQIQDLTEAADLGNFEGGARGILAAFEQIGRDADSGDESGTVARSLALKCEAVTSLLSIASRAVRSYASQEQRKLEARMQRAIDSENMELLQNVLKDCATYTQSLDCAALESLGLDGDARRFSEAISSLRETAQHKKEQIDLERKKVEVEKEQQRKKAQEAERLRQLEQQRLQQLEKQRQQEVEREIAEKLKQDQQQKLLEAQQQRQMQLSNPNERAARPALNTKTNRVPTAEKLRSIVSATRDASTADYSHGAAKSATTIQSVFRGSRIRRRFETARREIAGLWGDEGDDFGEVDIDKFLDLAGSTAGVLGDDPDWMNDVFDELGEEDAHSSSSNDLNVDDSSGFDDSHNHNYPATSPSSAQYRPSPSSSVTHAAAMSHLRRSKGHSRETMRPSVGRQTLPPLQQNRQEHDVVSPPPSDTRRKSRADKEAEILNEWGFSNPETAKHMLRRRKKFEKAARKRKTSKKHKRSRGSNRSTRSNKAKAQKRYNEFMAHMGLQKVEQKRQSDNYSDDRSRSTGPFSRSTDA